MEQAIMEQAMTHSRTETPLRSYEVAVKSLMSRCAHHKNEEIVKEVVKVDNGDKIEFDYPNLAKSLESIKNVYFRYTLLCSTRSR